MSVEFNHDAARQYDERHEVGVLSQAVLQVLGQMDWYLCPQQRVLDFGCGTGHNAMAMAQQGHTVTGCDVSQDMLDIFRSKLKEDAVKDRITLMHSDPNGSDLPVGAFEVACASFVLHHVPVDSQQTIIVNLAKTLQKEGHLVVFEFEDTARSRAIRESFAKEFESSHGSNASTKESTEKSHAHYGHGHHGKEWMNRQTLKKYMETAGLNVSTDQHFQVKLPQGIMDCYYMIGTKQ